MRIAYDNLIDDLNASTLTALTTATGYTVLDVQDQRLSTRWLSSVSTSQSITIELPTFPLLPDGTTGTIYRSDFSAGVDGWAWNLGASNGSVYATVGNLYLDATTNTVYASLQIVRTTAWVTGSSVYIRYGSNSSLTSMQYYNGTSYTSFATVASVVDGGYSIVEAVMVKGSTYSVLNVVFNFASSAIAAINTIKISDVYVGTGAYTSVLADQSGNGNNLNVYGAIPVAVSGRSCLYLDGNADYLRSTNVLASSPDVWHFHQTLPSGNASLSQYQTLLNYKAQSTTVGYLWIFRLQNTNNLGVQYSTGSDNVFLTFTNFFLGYSTAHITLDVYVNWITGIVTVYRNGAFFETQAMTTPVKPTSGSYLYFGSYQGAAHFFAGVIDEPRLYNRELSANEISKLYSRDRFISENFGLFGYWPVDYNLEVNTSAILGHNILPGTGVKIQASNNNLDWASPEVDTSMVVNSETILTFFSTTYVYKYWKFSFTGQGSIQIGRLWLGSYITIDPSSLIGFKVTKLRSDNVFHGRNRQKWASVGIGWRRFELSFPPTEEDMLYLIQLLYDAVGKHSSFIFCNFDTIREYALVEPCYVAIPSDMDFDNEERMKFTYKLVMEEEK